MAVIHGQQRVTYRQFYARCRQLASALDRHGIGRGDTVSVMLSNTPPMLEAHYGVPMTGAVLHSINTRLDAGVIAFQLDHADSKVLIVDREFAPTIRAALDLVKSRPFIIEFDDKEFPQPGDPLPGTDYEAFVSGGDPEFAWRMPNDEWDAIALNYTSGTTGNPKGVVYHHRGAYLMCFANVVAAGMGRIRSTCGRCRCSTAMAGASLDAVGRRARTFACAGCGRRPFTTPSPSTGYPSLRRADRYVDTSQCNARGEKTATPQSAVVTRQRRRPSCSPQP